MLYIVGGLLLVLYLVFRFGMNALFGLTPSEEKIKANFVQAIDEPSYHTYEAEASRCTMQIWGLIVCQPSYLYMDLLAPGMLTCDIFWIAVW